MLTVPPYPQTPLGALPVDTAIVAELAGHTMAFLTRDEDEAEHSIEMQLPYLRKVTEGRDVKVVPVVIGDLGKDRGEALGRIFAKWLGKEGVFFILSSDFCHWGKRFAYTRGAEKAPNIGDFVHALDQQGTMMI
jgi:MEMO1 family protein